MLPWINFAAPIAQQQIDELGYCYFPSLIWPFNFQKYLSKLLVENGMKNDLDITSAKALYKDPVFERLLSMLQPIMEYYTGKTLFKTYSYARIYKNGNKLNKHTDRFACEYTLSIALHYEKHIWPLWLEDKKGQPIKALLVPGDAILFKGIDVPHWRNTNNSGEVYQVFLHYVDRLGAYARYKDDNR